MGLRSGPRIADFWLYVALSAVFWLALYFAGGGAETDTRSIGIGWQGAAISFALLLPLWSGRAWAWYLLLFSSLAYTVGIGFWISEGPFGLLSILTLLQMALLWRMRTPRERRPDALDALTHR